MEFIYKNYYGEKKRRKKDKWNGSKDIHKHSTLFRFFILFSFFFVGIFFFNHLNTKTYIDILNLFSTRLFTSSSNQLIMIS